MCGCACVYSSSFFFCLFFSHPTFHFVKLVYLNYVWYVRFVIFFFSSLLACFSKITTKKMRKKIKEYFKMCLLSNCLLLF